VLSSTWVAHHRLVTLSLGFALLVVAVAFGVWLFLLRSPGTQVGLGQAVRQFRAGQDTDPAAADPALPPPGVYQYRTTGGERLSVADISRPFPATTPMVVTDSRCATMTWEPLEQHREGLVVCAGGSGALAITSVPTEEEIAGTRTTDDLRCPARTYLVPPDATAGDRWRSVCHGSDDTVAVSGEVVGPSTVTIDGRRVPAWHTELGLAYSGSQSGSNPNQYWISSRNGMVLRQRESVSVSERSGPFGSVHYSEQMTITLTSLRPAR